ncbi:uncharacterized protein [Littorina saxatilis]|uniref:uncharacterized protein isoform X3 n=1 Tax=Littorina saxatilis TaxID=31220 RepID=UPI0038B63E5C
MRRNFFPAFLAVYFFVTASIAAEKWSPHIWSRYSVARSVLEVHIAPPRAGASDYWVGAMTTDDQRIFVEKSKCVQKSDSEIIYEVKGFPTDRAKQYVVLVRARDVNGEFLSSYMSNKTAITIPPFDRAVITVPAPGRTSRSRSWSVRSRTSQGSQTTTISDTSNGVRTGQTIAHLPMMPHAHSPAVRCTSAGSEDSVFA